MYRGERPSFLDLLIQSVFMGPALRCGAVLVVCVETGFQSERMVVYSIIMLVGLAWRATVLSCLSLIEGVDLLLWFPQ